MLTWTKIKVIRWPGHGELISIRPFRQYGNSQQPFWKATWEYVHTTDQLQQIYIKEITQRKNKSSKITAVKAWR